jgi:hypothetical protein
MSWNWRTLPCVVSYKSDGPRCDHVPFDFKGETKQTYVVAGQTSRRENWSSCRQPTGRRGRRFTHSEWWNKYSRTNRYCRGAACHTLCVNCTGEGQAFCEWFERPGQRRAEWLVGEQHPRHARRVSVHPATELQPFEQWRHAESGAAILEPQLYRPGDSR